MKEYRKKGTIFARPYKPGEIMEGISVSPNDKLKEGGWIAHSPRDMRDRWYISAEFFAENYEEV